MIDPFTGFFTSGNFSSKPTSTTIIDGAHKQCLALFGNQAKPHGLPFRELGQLTKAQLVLCATHRNLDA